MCRLCLHGYRWRFLNFTCRESHGFGCVVPHVPSIRFWGEWILSHKAISHANKNNNRWQFFVSLLVAQRAPHLSNNTKNHQSFFGQRSIFNPQTNFGWKEGINFYIRKKQRHPRISTNYPKLIEKVVFWSHVVQKGLSTICVRDLRVVICWVASLFGLATWCGSGPFQVGKELISSVHFESMSCWPCGF